jgi:hypothetical protein
MVRTSVHAVGGVLNQRPFCKRSEIHADERRQRDGKHQMGVQRELKSSSASCRAAGMFSDSETYHSLSTVSLLVGEVI